jgi:hypothetical protein
LYHWAVIRFVAAAAGCYIAWLLLFEQWLEPWLRRCGGALVGSSIDWVPAGGPFRIWGLLDRRSVAIHAAVGFLGGMTVLLSAALPAALLLYVATKTHAEDATMAATSYLISLPMVALFVLRVSSVKAEARETMP